MRKFILSFIFTLTFLPLFAQEIPAGAKLSLEDCIALTLKHNPTLQAAYLNTQVQQNRLSQARADYMPKVNGNASYSRSNQEGAGGWGDAQDGYSSSISATQLIYDFGKAGLSNKIQKNNLYSSNAPKKLISTTVFFVLSFATILSRFIK